MDSSDMNDRRCIGCEQTFIPDEGDSEELCYECEHGIET